MPGTGLDGPRASPAEHKSNRCQQCVNIDDDSHLSGGYGMAICGLPPSGSYLLEASKVHHLLDDHSQLIDDLLKVPERF
jgi:hypothetical protein